MRTVLLAIFAASASALTIFPAYSQDFIPGATGNHLYEACSTPQGTAHLGCTGYILGAYDALNAVDSSLKPVMVCMPNGATAQQVIDITYKFLVQYPELRTRSAAQLVWAALAGAFPC